MTRGAEKASALGVGREQLGAPQGLLHPEPYLSPTQAGHPAARPSFLSRTIQDLGIGTFRDLAVVLETAPILTALDIFVDRRVSPFHPVINEAGTYTQDGDSGWGGAVGSQDLCGLSLGPRMESGLESLPALSLGSII